MSLMRGVGLIKMSKRKKREGVPRRMRRRRCCMCRHRPVRGSDSNPHYRNNPHYNYRNTLLTPHPLPTPASHPLLPSSQNPTPWPTSPSYPTTHHPPSRHNPPTPQTPPQYPPKSWSDCFPKRNRLSCCRQEWGRRL